MISISFWREREAQIGAGRIGNGSDPLVRLQVGSSDLFFLPHQAVAVRDALSKALEANPETAIASDPLVPIADTAEDVGAEPLPAPTDPSWKYMAGQSRRREIAREL